MLAGHPAGPRTAYVNRPAPAGAREYPTGTMVVEVVTRADRPERPEAFAMVKRGGDYNASGAKGWEFFLLLIARDGTPTVVSRGVDPSDGAANEYTGQGFGCNTCHGAEDTRSIDHVLSPALRPPGAEH